MSRAAVGRAGSLNAWTRMYHPEHAPAWIVAMPWQRAGGVALLKDDPDPGVLADRLAAFAEHVGITYRLSSTITGLDLIDHTRPPRNADEGVTENRRGRAALVRGQAAELPPFLHKVDDGRFASLEADFHWWRTWDTLHSQERACRYVHLYDRGKSYLAPWRNLDLGLEGLRHATGDEAAWDGTEKPGYYLVDRWHWTDWSRPDPGTGAIVGEKAWVTSITLAMLARHGVTPAVHESYTWERTSRYLEAAGKRLSEAVKNPDLDFAVHSMVKSVYRLTTGKFAERDHIDHHLWRPDWRHHIIARTRDSILRTIDDVRDRTGAVPVLAVTDALGFVSDNPDPVAAWPGNPDRLGSGPGQWSPLGRADLATWGPTALVQGGGRWAYDRHTSGLVLPD